MAKVSIVKCTDYNSDVTKKVEEAMKLIQAEKILKKGQKVLLKPNILMGANPEKAISTHPKVMDALIVYLKKFNVKIYIGESSGMGAPSGTDAAFKKSGIADVAKKHAVPFVNFDSDEHKVISVKGAKVLKSMQISKKLLEMDMVIDVCKLKTHMMTYYSGAIKNMYGVLPGRAKMHGHFIGKSIKGFSNILLDVYMAKIPTLILMDGIVGMEGNGPSNGSPKKTNLLLASDNGIALDIVASRIIGFKEKELIMFQLAKQRGLFPENITVLGEKNVSVPYKKPLKLFFDVNSLASMTVFSFLRSGFDSDKSLCKKCGICISHCPEKTIYWKKGYPYFDKKKCIMCYCCHELCPYHAVLLKKSFVAKVADKILKRYND